MRLDDRAHSPTPMKHLVIATWVNGICLVGTPIVLLVLRLILLFSMFRITLHSATDAVVIVLWFGAGIAICSLIARSQFRAVFGRQQGSADTSGTFAAVVGVFTVLGGLLLVISGVGERAAMLEHLLIAAVVLVLGTYMLAYAVMLRRWREILMGDGSPPDVCHACGYDLRGTPHEMNRQCPECGVRVWFDPEQLPTY